MFFIGVDLGQKCDFTAIAVVERPEAPLTWMQPDYSGLEIRWLERIPLGTPYTDVVRRVEAIAWKLGCDCVIVVDGTGLGAPVVDLLRQSRLPCEVDAVVMTGGDQESKSKGVWRVPKKDLVAGIQVLLENAELRIAKDLKEARSLVRELKAMRAKKTRSGRTRLGADGGGEHDDLVMAVGLACWRAERKGIGFGPGRLPGI